MVLSRLTKITGPGIRTDTNWVGNNANYTGILTAASLGGIGNITATGIITAASFSGDGSGLIGVASTDNIVTGTAATFNTYPVDINAGMTVAGVATFAGNVSIAGTLTYEDVTNIDSVGIITGKGADINGDLDVDGHTNLDNVSIAGVSTHSEGIHIPDNKRLDFGGTAGDGDFEIRHTSGNTFIENNTGAFFITQGTSAASNPLTIHGGSELQLKHYYSNGGALFALKSVRGYQTEIYYQGAKKIETTAKGILVGTGVTIETNGQATFVGIVTFGSSSTTINGNTDTINVGTALTIGHSQGLQYHTQNLHAQGFEVNQINASGIITATSFSGSGANLTSLPAANLTGTLPAISGANLTSLPAANLTGTLPAISGANLTNLPTATSITVADESSDTTCYPLYVTATSGNLAPKTGTNLVFNSASGNLRTASVFCGTSSNESKTQDGLILERNSGDGEVHITAGRSGGNYSGMQFYVAGASGVTKRHLIDYQSNFRWYGADGTTERLRIDSTGRISAGKHGVGTYNDASEWLKVQSNDTAANISIVGSNDTHSSLNLGDEDDFNIQKIRSDHTDNKLQFYTNNTERLILQNGGVLSQRVGTYARFSHGILEITTSSTPSQIKITTNLPYSGSSSHAESVTIRGFRYGGRDTVELQICWHVYAGQFYNRIASSSGGWAPLITLGVENNKVVIHMDSLGYWPKIYVADYYSSFNSEAYAKGWSWSDSAISGDSGTPVNTVPYKNDWGGLEYNSDHAVGTNPDRHLNIKNGNLIIGTNGHGIDFSASSHASGQTSELFDDYEEGSWTPAYSRPNMTLSHGYQQGFYTKVGRAVHVVGRLYTTSESGSSSGGPILVTGLPFTVREVRCALSLRPSQWSNDHPSFATFELNQTHFELLEEVEGNPSGSQDLGGGRFAGGNGNYLWFSGTYFTDT